MFGLLLGGDKVTLIKNKEGNHEIQLVVWLSPYLLYTLLNL